MAAIARAATAATVMTAIYIYLGITLWHRGKSRFDFMNKGAFTQSRMPFIRGPL
jgi:hypothetical protein